MAKKVKAIIKLQIEAGKANPAPPIGPTLAPHGVNVMAFCKEYNARTAPYGGADRAGGGHDLHRRLLHHGAQDASGVGSPASAAGVEKGSSEPNRQIVGKITRQQLREIAELKMKDLNTDDIEAAMRMIAGTARSMGIQIVD
jgi:large subunit ribosomal protein L11